MEEEDDTRGDSSSPPILPPSDVAKESPSRNALALIVHTPSVTSGKRNGGRDDCWSEEATKILIEAWGDRFSEAGKGTLKQQQWNQVAEIVNSSGQCKYPKTDIQCKNRIDTVKKKFKLEKSKIASEWIFFNKLESLIGDSKPPIIHKRQGKETQIALQGRDSMRWHFRKRSASETESESEAEPDSPESLPPPPTKRMKIDKRGGSEVGDVAKAIFGFTEAYEKAETAKLKLMMELEKERMEFAKEMELRRMKFLKTQLELTQKNQEKEEEEEEEEEEESSMRGESRLIHDDDDHHRNVKNNGNVSI